MDLHDVAVGLAALIPSCTSFAIKGQAREASIVHVDCSFVVAAKDLELITDVLNAAFAHRARPGEIVMRAPDE